MNNNYQSKSREELINDLQNLELEVNRLKVSEEKYKLIFENSIIGKSLTGVDGSLHVNKAFSYILGYTEDELKVKKWQEITYPEDINESTEIIDNLIKGKANSARYNKRYIHKNGNIIWTDISTSLHRDSEGNPIYFITNIIDITERKQAEEALIESEEKFRGVFESNMLGTIFWNAKGDIIDANDAFLEIVGYSREDLISGALKWNELTPPKYDKIDEGKLKDLAERGKIEPFEKEYIHKSGRIIPIIISAATLSASKTSGVAIILDITDRKRMEKDLKESEERFRIAAETSNDVVYEWDLEQEVKWFGKIDEMLGYNPGEFPRTLEGLGASVHPEDWVRVMAAVQAHLEGRAPYAEDYRVLMKDGTFRWWSARGAVSRTPDGKPVRWVGTVTDITERVKAEKALVDEELKFRTIFDKASDGILLAENGSMTFYLANNKICEMLGYTQEEILKIGLSEIHPEKDLPYAIEQFERLARNEISLAVDIPVMKKDGSIFYADINSSSISLGGKDYLIGVFRDITERKRVEEEIRNNEKRFKELVNSLPQLVWTCRVDGPCDYLSLQWINFTGIPEEKQLGYGWLEQLHPDDRERTISEWMEKVKTGASFDIEFRIRRHDGVYRWFTTKAIPMKDSAGNIVKWFGSNTDFDDIKKAEEQLRDAMKNLERSNQELEQFAYVASHDLQEPLRMVSSFTQLLERRYKDKLDEDANDFIHYAVDGANRMQKLINDLLDYSRITSRGKDFTKVDISQVLGQVISNLQQLIIDNTALITNDDLPGVKADESQILRIFQNLIENALKFKKKTELPIIHISCKKKNGFYEFAIMDNGIGIDMQYQERVFTIFQRLHSKEEYPGTGIGLSICKRIVERHGGKIWFESKVNEGTTFYFTLKE